MAELTADLPPGFTLLQVTPELETGGVEQTTVDVAAAVVKAGGRSIVASRGGRMERRLAEAGVRFVRIPAHSKNPLVVGLNVVRLARLIRREKVALVHVRSRAPAFSALIAARATGTPLIATYHGVYNARSAVKRWYNAVMTRGRAIIANSCYTRDHVIAQHGVAPEKVTAIVRGVDMAAFDPLAIAPARLLALRQAWRLEAGDERLKVLMAGRLTRWKGQLLLIEAAARLKAAGREDFLIIVAGDDQGRAAYRLEMDTAIAAARLQNQVVLVGHCFDMPAAYMLTDVTAAPSLDPEAFGRTAVEPQVMGKPVLAADHGATRETVIDGRTGWLVAPGDPQAWADALARVIDAGPADRAAMGEAAQARARRLYSVETMCAATLALYGEVLGSGP